MLFGKVPKCKVRALETRPIYWNRVGAVREWKGILPHVVLMIIMSGNCETMIILIIKFIQPMSAPTPPTLPLLPTQLSPVPYFQVFENCLEEFSVQSPLKTTVIIFRIYSCIDTYQSLRKFIIPKNSQEILDSVDYLDVIH